MPEMLLTETAKHYLMSGHSFGETIMVTVSASEINVILRIAKSNEPVESNIIAQATTLDKVNYGMMLKQVQSVEDVEAAEKAGEGNLLAIHFISNLDSYLQMVETRRIADKDSISQPLYYLRQSLKELLDQLAG